MQKTNFYKAIAFLFIMMSSLSVGCAEDQETSDLPKLPQSSENLTDFVPLFWAIECISQGDLNKDGQLDTAMVVKKSDESILLFDEDCEICRPVEINPAMLIVLFADGNNWRLVTQNTTFIMSYLEYQNSFNSIDGFDIKAGKGTLSVRIYWFSTSLGYDDYKFRWQDDDFYLIGFDAYSRHRMTGEETTSSYNFLTWRKNIVRKTFVDDEKRDETTKKSVWKPLNERPLLKLDQIIEAKMSYYLLKVDNHK